MAKTDIEAVRLPNCPNPYQVILISHIATTAREIVSIGEDAAIVEVVKLLQAHLYRI